MSFSGFSSLLKSFAFYIVMLIALFFPFKQPVNAQTDASTSAETDTGSPKLNSSQLTRESKFIIGSSEYSQEEIIWDFLRVAFSDALWLEDEKYPAATALSPFALYLNPYGIDKNDATKDPYLNQFITRPDGLPRHNAIVKWMDQISIGLDWSPAQDPIAENRFKIPYYLNIYHRFGEQIQALLPDISAITGLPVTFVPRTSESDITQDVARIRIIPIETTHGRNNFKTIKFYESYSSTMDIVENKYMAAIPFTSSARSQVEGVILPNPDNSIGFVTCKILTSLPDSMVKALIAECLLRALGLPETSHLEQSALLADWNGSMDKFSKRPRYDGDDAYWNASNLKKKNDLSTFSQESLHAAERHMQLTPYDMFLASLLYCSAIKPGMDKYQAILALLNTPSCFNNNLIQKESK